MPSWLLRLATLRKRKQRAGVTEEAETEEKLRGREQKQRDLDESEQEAMYVSIIASITR